MRIAFTFLLFICFISLSGQEKDANLSLEFENKSVLEVLLEIEQKTDYHFYYVEAWLDKKKFSKGYKNSTIENILNDLFLNTKINFFIDVNKRIILSLNNLIYNDLPKGFLRNLTKLCPHLKTKLLYLLFFWKNMKITSNKL